MREDATLGTSDGARGRIVVASEPGWVYIVQEGDDGPIKIGWASNQVALGRRLETLQTGNPRELRFRGFFPGTRDDERDFQTIGELERIRGEWFKPEGELRHLLWALDFLETPR